MKSARFYKIIIAILVILNIGMISFIFVGKPPHHIPPGKGHLLSFHLGLTGEDKINVDRLEKEHHRLKRKLMRYDAELHQSLFESVGSEMDPSDKIQTISENRKAIETMTYQFFDEVSSYCDASQLKELKQFIQNGMARISQTVPEKK